jgi:NTP pyrophosphatase (non-canonical NTP hydrolase)
MTTVKEVQEEVVIIATGLSQLMLPSNSRKKQSMNSQDISSVLYSVIKVCSVLGLSMVDVLTKKMEINSRKYPKTSCQKDTKVQHYTKYTGETGIKKDSDVPLFQDINAMMIPLEGFYTRVPDLYKQNKIDFDSHFASLMEQVTTFATERKWISNYTNESIYLSLLSELGELSSVLQWVPQNITINEITMHQKDTLARELADVVIYLVHLCRVRNVTPVVADGDVKEGLNHGGIAFVESDHIEISVTEPVAKRLRHGE